MPDRHHIPTIDNTAIAAAADALRGGEVVVFPTETVYGLGADATNADAVAAVFRIKRRPAINPLIVHVAGTDVVERLVGLNTTARNLAEHLWPGPLTLIVPRPATTAIVPAVSANLPTLAIRVPAHPVAHKLLLAVDRPVAAPSANLAGHLSPTRTAHIDPAVAAAVAAVLDAGPTGLGLESTVVDTTGPRPRILRLGAITSTTIAKTLGQPVAIDAIATDDRPTSPGMLLRHYAPTTPLRLNATTAAPDEAYLAFGPHTSDTGAPGNGARVTRNLSPAGDLEEAAANLYHLLHSLDAAGCRTIAVAPIPNDGLGEAINERLTRAAAGT